MVLSREEPGIGFQESFPSGVTKDLLVSSSNEYDKTYEMLYTKKAH